MKVVRLIKYLCETYSEIRICKSLFDVLPIQNGLKKRCFVAIFFQLCFRICH